MNQPKLSKKGPDTTDEIRRFRQLVRSVQLKGVHLLNTTSAIDMDALELIDESNYEMRVHPSQLRSHLDQKTRVLYVGVRLIMELVSRADSTKRLCGVEAEYALFYLVRDEVEYPDSVVRLFASKNAVFNVWPYFRELVHSLAARAGLPNVLVPLFKLPVLPQGPSQAQQAAGAQRLGSTRAKRADK